ncbi:MAG: cytidylate kinase-like family protein [Bacteroidales bacterium]|nr:cytidylate kinase-like family protein [Bacteroidales bacterium]MBN2698582.1 cytidylate kinase-like family protein [Bacteroidales bacterium]
MKIDLSKYLDDWYKEDSAKKIFPGPVITISREAGCPAKTIAADLEQSLNKLKSTKAKPHPWRWLSKEMMQDFAKEFNVDYSHIDDVFKFKKRSVLEDILLAQSTQYYTSDFKVRATIAKVIRTFANKGNAIIVGRGGVAITRDIPKSLHIQLEAPLEWRALRISEKYDVSIEHARQYTKQVDKKRIKFRDSFQGQGTDYTRFDMTFNCMTLNIQEIEKIIIGALKVREMI